MPEIEQICYQFLFTIIKLQYSNNTHSKLPYYSIKYKIETNSNDSKNELSLGRSFNVDCDRLAHILVVQLSI